MPEAVPATQNPAVKETKKIFMELTHIQHYYLFSNRYILDIPSNKLPNF